MFSKKFQHIFLFLFLFLFTVNGDYHHAGWSVNENEASRANPAALPTIDYEGKPINTSDSYFFFCSTSEQRSATKVFPLIPIVEYVSSWYYLSENATNGGTFRLLDSENRTVFDYNKYEMKLLPNSWSFIMFAASTRRFGRTLSLITDLPNGGCMVIYRSKQIPSKENSDKNAFFVIDSCNIETSRCTADSRWEMIYVNNFTEPSPVEWSSIKHRVLTMRPVNSESEAASIGYSLNNGGNASCLRFKYFSSQIDSNHNKLKVVAYFPRDNYGKIKQQNLWTSSEDGETGWVGVIFEIPGAANRIQINTVVRSKQTFVLDDIKLINEPCPAALRCDFEPNSLDCPLLQQSTLRRNHWALDGSDSDESILNFVGRYALLRHNNRSVIQMGQFMSPIINMKIDDAKYTFGFYFYVPECASHNHLTISMLKFKNGVKEEKELTFHQEPDKQYWLSSLVHVSIKEILESPLEPFRFTVSGYLGLENCSMIAIDNVILIGEKQPNLKYQGLDYQYKADELIVVNDYFSDISWKVDNDILRVNVGSRSLSNLLFTLSQSSAPKECEFTYKYRINISRIIMYTQILEENWNVLSISKKPAIGDGAWHNASVYIGFQRLNFRVAFRVISTGGLNDKIDGLFELKSVTMKNCNPQMGDAILPRINCSDPSFKCTQYDDFESQESANWKNYPNIIEESCYWAGCEFSNVIMNYSTQSNEIPVRDHTFNEHGKNVALVQRKFVQFPSVSGFITSKNFSSDGRCVVEFYVLQDESKTRLVAKTLHPETQESETLPITTEPYLGDYKKQTIRIPVKEKFQLIFIVTLPPLTDPFVAFDDILFNEHCKIVA